MWKSSSWNTLLQPYHSRKVSHRVSTSDKVSKTRGWLLEFDWDRGLRIKVVILQIYLDMQYVGWNFENYSVFWDCYLWQNLCQTEAEFRNDNSPLIRDTLVYEIIAKLETEWKWRSFTELWHVRHSLTKHSTQPVKMRKQWSFLEKILKFKYFKLKPMMLTPENQTR